MIIEYVCAWIVAYTIAGHFEKKNDAHELKNEERSHKMILSTNFRGLKKSLLGFMKYPSQAKLALCSENLVIFADFRTDLASIYIKQPPSLGMFWENEVLVSAWSRLWFLIVALAAKSAFDL